MHPLNLLSPEEIDMIDVWAAWRGEMARGHLPFAGGTADQPACVMTALAVMESAYRMLKPPASED